MARFKVVYHEYDNGYMDVAVNGYNWEEEIITANSKNDVFTKLNKKHPTWVFNIKKDKIEITHICTNIIIDYIKRLN